MTSSDNKWLLVAINPWYRWEYNPVTKQSRHVDRSNESKRIREKRKPS